MSKNVKLALVNYFLKGTTMYYTFSEIVAKLSSDHASWNPEL